jgi:hypothetical protein
METFVAVAVLLGVPILIGWMVFRRPNGPERVCVQCGHCAPTVSKTPGSTGVELLAWLLFIVPGLIYSLWRLSGRRQVCAVCGHDKLVPPDSPVGRKLRA